MSGSDLISALHKRDPESEVEGLEETLGAVKDCLGRVLTVEEEVIVSQAYFSVQADLDKKA